jgi:hypothetical protein
MPLLRSLLASGLCHACVMLFLSFVALSRSCQGVLGAIVKNKCGSADWTRPPCQQCAYAIKLEDRVPCRCAAMRRCRLMGVAPILAPHMAKPYTNPSEHPCTRCILTSALNWPTRSPQGPSHVRSTLPLQPMSLARPAFGQSRRVRSL